METPDTWIILKLMSDSGTHYRVFAGWYGGYLGSDSWRMNSGITKAELMGDFWLFTGSSGSIYKCHANSYKMSSYQAGILSHIKNQSTIVSIEEMPKSTDWKELDYNG